MAVTLPYPDMEFVPLDILTAQEQNQLVTNIEYLAGVFPLASSEIADNAVTTGKINNGAVTESKIADGAVTSNKIDWDSLESSYIVDSNFSIDTVGVTKCQYTVQATGKYLVITDASYNILSATHFVYLTVFSGSTAREERYTSAAANAFSSLSVVARLSCNAGDVISVKLRDSLGIPASGNTRVACAVVRIG